MSSAKKPPSMTQLEILSLINQVVAEKEAERAAYKGNGQEIEALVSEHQADVLRGLAQRFQVAFLKRRLGK